MCSIGRCVSGGLPPEKSFEVTPSKPSESALLQNRMHLPSSLVFVLRKRNWSLNMTLSNFEH